MLRTLLVILILFALTVVVLYATDCVRRYGAAILTVALGLITCTIAVPFTLILGMMYLTGAPGEAAYAVSELQWTAPVAVAGAAMLAVSVLIMNRRPPPSPPPDAPV